MKSLIYLLLLLHVNGPYVFGYAIQQQSGYSSYGSSNRGYGSSSYSSSSASRYGASSSSSAAYTAAGSQSCCKLNSWAYQNINDIRHFANRLRQEYNSMSSGSTGGYSMHYTPWPESIITLTGKTPGELDAICRAVSEQLVYDMRKGMLNYNTVAQPNFFEWKAVEALQPLALHDVDQGQQQSLDLGHYQPQDFDEVKNYNYPPEFQVIDGKTYVVHRNETEAHKTSGLGTFESPYVQVVKRNRTVITTNAAPPYTPSVNFGIPNTMPNTAATPMYTQPSNSGYSNVVTRKKTILGDWVRENMEPGVMGYRPEVTLNNNNWTPSTPLYKPPIHIPVESDTQSSYGAFNSASQVYASTYPTGSIGMPRPSSYPTTPIESHESPGTTGSTVTVRHYNKTIITNPDGTNLVQGSESHKKWVDGKLVYDTERPFGQWTVPRDDDWKREERERFFWFLTSGATTPQRLDMWQRQQEERLMALAQRYHITLQDIQEWHRKELERYKALLSQYQVQTAGETPWQRMERGRLDWLIHQNSVTREELQRWQQENQDKLYQLARQYHIPLDELKRWQVDELDRLYVHFNDQNKSMLPTPPTDSLIHNSEQARLDELIRQHNATIEQLHNSIKMDQQKLRDLSTRYRGNVEDMEKWLKSEVARLSGVINEQRSEMTRITEWQRAERERLENIVKQHKGSIGDIDNQLARDRMYLEKLAKKYHVSIEELENWQRSELERLQREGQNQFELDIKEWQQREHENLKQLIAKNDLSIADFQTMILEDKQRLENLAETYDVQVTEIEDWLKRELNNLKNEGILKDVEKQLADWQQKERNRLLDIVRQSELTVNELELKLKNDQTHLNELAAKYRVQVSEIENWLKTELARLQSQGLIKTEDLEDWQKHERDVIFELIQDNKLTIEELERKLFADRQRLQDLAKMYHVGTQEIETWIKSEGQRLQNLGLLQLQEELNNWQQIERDRLMTLIQQNNLSLKELEEKIQKDQVHLYSLAHQHQVKVEEIEEWIKKEIQRLQAEGLIELEKLKDWQLEWRTNLTNMVKERDFTVEEFHKWLLEDRARLQALAMQHNVQIEEIEDWIRNEEKRFISMGLLKPNEKLTNWQEVERRYVERIAQDRYHSTEQLEQRLRQDRELLEQLARDYQIQVGEIEEWMKKELARLRDEGQLHINNLSAWQIAERERLNTLLKQNNQLSAEEFEAILRQDRDHLEKTAFQYHTSVEEIEKWIKQEIDRLQRQGKLNIEQLTAWQKAQQQRILALLQQQSSITAEDFERKVHQDRAFLMNLARQYHVSINEVEQFIKKVIDDLKVKGKFEIDNVKAWQSQEREYIKQLINQYQNSLSTEEYEQKLRNDRIHLNQLADLYRVNVREIEEWMIRELHRLRQESGDQIQQLAAWQANEIERLKKLIQDNQRITYVQFQVELRKERERLQQLAQQYAVSVDEIEKWLKQQLLNLKTIGHVQVENLTKWQEDEQKRLISLCLQKQHDITTEEFEQQLRRDRGRLQRLAHEHNMNVEKIEQWMKNELQRLQDSGLVHVEELTQWQRMERQRLQDWLRQQNTAITVDELEAFIKRDKERLQQIARDYQVTVEEIESWVEQEGARLQLLGLVKGPANTNYEYHTSMTTHTTTSQTGRPMNHQLYWTTTPTSHTNSYENIWREQTRGHLQAVAQMKPMTWSDFEDYLIKERVQWEQFARQYNITVDDIHRWLRQSAMELAQQGLIQNQPTGPAMHGVEQKWQTDERNYIQNLINGKLRQQQQWSLEELERQLKNDHDHVQRLANEYHVTIEEIETWYKQELQRFLNQGQIISENLSDWQKVQKDRLYTMVVRQPDRTLAQWEQLVLRDRTALSRFCDQYHVSMEELERWIQNELRRLQSLGLIREYGYDTSATRGWQDQEIQRLRAIAGELLISEEEFVEFIANDLGFQQQLTKHYGCRLEQLAPFQRIEINKMYREGLLDPTNLLPVESWQRSERDRLYNFIRDKSYTLHDLLKWQKQETFINNLAAKYGITAQTLKDWQVKEFQRLQHLASYYQMNLNQLQDFRDKEIRYITYVMHKKFSTDQERIAWGANEAQRMNVLERKTGLNGQELINWRRKLYLLCQGRLPFTWDGYENGSRIPPLVLSKDRGDQPPHVHEESDVDEPGVENQTVPHDVHETRPQHQPTATYIGSDGSTSASTRYSRKQYTYKASAKHPSNPMDHDEDGQQHQLEDMDDDFGQQMQQFDDLADPFIWQSQNPQKYSDKQHQQEEYEDGQIKASSNAKLHVQLR